MSTGDRVSSLEARRTRRRNQPSRGDQQEAAILDAAESLLETMRFADVTIAKVASAVGISRSAIYFYFGSMEELLTALVARGLADLITSIESVEVPPDTTPQAVLAAGLRTTAEGWRTHGNLLRLAVENAHAIPAVYSQWRGLLDRGIDLYVALMTWSADLEGRPLPVDDVARRHAELCMLMVGNAFHQLHIEGYNQAGELQLCQDLQVLVSRSLGLDQPTG